MSLQELHLSPEDIRIVRLAGMLVEEEMRFVRKELEKLRSDLALTSAIQRHELQTFYDDATKILKRIEQ
jgi:hypothetical protein